MGGEGGSGEHGVVLQEMLTWGHGLHVSGELAAHVVVVGADVVKTPVGQLVCAVELGTERKAPLLEPWGVGSAWSPTAVRRAKAFVQRGKALQL